MFIAQNLTVARMDKVIVSQLSLPPLLPGELLLITGVNGVGKSTALQGVMGLRGVVVTGELVLDTQDLISLSPQERFHAGIMCTYQNPPELEGVTIAQLAKHLLPEASMTDVLVRLRQALALLELPEEFMSQFVHAGLSGGQKKLVELLQVLVVCPKLALLDEIDSGLDSTKQQLAAKSVLWLRGKGTTVIAVSHSTSFGKLLKPTSVYEIV